MRILINALAISLVMVGSAAPSFAQSDNNLIVTIFRGGTAPASAANSAGRATPPTNGVTVMTGMPIVSATPRQTAELPGAAIATGNGANVNAGLGASGANRSGNTATGSAALGAGAGMSGGTVALPARGSAARPIAGGRGGLGVR